DSISVAGVPFNLPTINDDSAGNVLPGNWLLNLSTFEYFLYGTILATLLVFIIFMVSRRRHNKMLLAEINSGGVTDSKPDSLGVEDELRTLMVESATDFYSEGDELVEGVKAYFKRDLIGAVDLLRVWIHEDYSAQTSEPTQLKMDGIDKAARLLISLGKLTAGDVMKHLSNDEVVKLAHLIAAIGTVPQSVTETIFEEFSHLIEARHYISQGGYDFAKDALTKALGNDKSKEILMKIQNKPRAKRPFESVRQMDPMQLLNALIDEHPQTIALVLCYLSTDKAAKIISGLPERLQSDVAQRIGTMNNTSSQIVDAVEGVIETRLQNLVLGDMTDVGGLNTVVDILNAVDRGTQKQILNLLEEENPRFAQDVSDNLFTFEDMIYLDNIAIQRVIREVDQNVLPLALKGASDAAMEAIMKNISTRAAERLKEDIDYLGPVRLADVEKAQHEVVSIIRRLEDAGEIIISRGEENDVVY
ncbi:MAG: flagellar motor switch protein FliG, partial [Turicibacter sp.]